jgi:hypothetical protein
MPVNYWRGDAQPIAQVVTITITADDAATTYIITINTKTVSVPGSGTGTADTAAALQAALAASTIAEFEEITWTVSGSTVTGTATTAGVPFTATSSKSGGTGTIGAVTTTTTSQGPNDWNSVENWSLGRIPINGDDVVLYDSSVDLLYNLDHHTVTLSSLSIDSTYTGSLGLPRYNANGGYLEYRPTYLQIGVPVLRIGAGSGSGSGRIKIDSGSVAMTASVYSTGAAIDQGLPAVILKGTAAGSDGVNILNVQQGTVGTCLEPGDACDWYEVNIGFQQAPATDATVTLGHGCTLTQINQNGGVLSFYDSVTQLISYAGTATAYFDADITTLDLQGGTLYFQSDGTIGSATVGDGSTLDCSQDPRLKTITNLTMSPGSTFNDPNKQVTFTNPVYLRNCSLDQVALTLGQDVHIQRT